MSKHLPFEKTVKTKMMGSLEEVEKVSKCKHVWWCHQPYQPEGWENIFYRTCLKCHTRWAPPEKLKGEQQ